MGACVNMLSLSIEILLPDFLSSHESPDYVGASCTTEFQRADEAVIHLCLRYIVKRAQLTVLQCLPDDLPENPSAAGATTSVAEVGGKLAGVDKSGVLQLGLHR